MVFAGTPITTFASGGNYQDLDPSLLSLDLEARETGEFVICCSYLQFASLSVQNQNRVFWCSKTTVTNSTAPCF